MNAKNENIYFKEQDTQLLSKYRDGIAMRELGISNFALMNQLKAAGFNKDSIQALFIVPLVDAAWADDEIHVEERDAILKTLEKRGIQKDSEAFRLTSLWLEKKPTDEMFQRANELIGPLIDDLKKSGDGNVMWILEGTRRVAKATGCMFSRIGMGDSISRAEERVIRRIEKRIHGRN